MTTRRDTLRSMVPLTAAVLGGFGLAACREEPIRQSSTLPFVGRGTMRERAEQIRRAAVELGWVTRELTPGTRNAPQGRGGPSGGLMEAVNNRDGHNVVVNISYDTRSFTIRYVSSVGLNYDGARIHRYYNDRVERLEQAIQRAST